MAGIVITDNHVLNNKKTLILTLTTATLFFIISHVFIPTPFKLLFFKKTD